MEGFSQIPDPAQLIPELDAIAKSGLRRMRSVYRYLSFLPSLTVLGGPEDTSLGVFRDAFTRFIQENDDLTGPTSEMALLLFGATDETRGQNLEFRQREVGKVIVEGNTVTWEAVRKPKGRRYEVLEEIAHALCDAERMASQSPR